MYLEIYLLHQKLLPVFEHPASSLLLSSHPRFQWFEEGRQVVERDVTAMLGEGLQGRVEWRASHKRVGWTRRVMREDRPLPS